MVDDDDELVSGDPFHPGYEQATSKIEQEHVVDIDEKLVSFLRRRQEAYRRVFAGASVGDDVVIVLKDLTRFCRGEDTTFDPDPRIHALLTGRNEVYRRIMDHTRLDLDALVEKYTAASQRN